VQFAGPIKDSCLHGVKRAGGEPRQLWANFTYVVRSDDAAIAKIAALPYVRWTGHLPYNDRLATSVRKELEGAESDRLPRTRLLPHTYTVEFFDAKDIKPARPKIRKLGVKVVHQEPETKLVLVETSDKKAERQKAAQGPGGRPRSGCATNPGADSALHQRRRVDDLGVPRTRRQRQTLARREDGAALQIIAEAGLHLPSL
jgi:hypothetical protein